jgi:light-regulated signal transduction histidine kinase (bacteriophytochrome)
MPFLPENSSQIGSELSLPSSQQRLLSQITTQINRSLELPEILATAVAQVRAFLGADRVKIYQFQPDFHGLVIAEALNGDRLPSLLNLHFPADDIPPYARELYLRSRARTIVDLDSQSIGISPLEYAENGQSSGADLQYRSVDPCHVEYLRAMGVKSSLVIPIVIEGTNTSLLPSLQPEEHLWGLLVSHDADRREVTETELSSLQFVVDRLSVAITQSMLLQRVREQAQQEANLNSVTSSLHATDTIELQTSLERTVAIFEGVGGRLYLPQNSTVDRPIQNSQQYAHLYVCGTQPDSIEDIAAEGGLRERYIEENLLWQKYLMSAATPTPVHDGSSLLPVTGSVEWMRSIYALAELPSASPIDSNIWAIADIYREPLFRSISPAFEATDIRGLLIIPLQLGKESIGCLTIFRGNIDKELVWAGSCDTDKRQMTPRQSFEAWRQIKTGQAQEWTPVDLKLAQALSERFTAAVKQHRLYEQVQILNANLNQQIQIRTAELEHTTEIARQQRALARVLGTLQQAWDVETTIRTATQEVRQLLEIDRVAIYRFNEDWGGSFMTDCGAVTPGWEQIILETNVTWNKYQLSMIFTVRIFPIAMLNY